MGDDKPVTITIGHGADAHFNARRLVRKTEELKRQATLADVRQEFDRCFENHGRFAERLSALSRTGTCPAADAEALLQGLARNWFSPDVTAAVYGQIDRLSDEVSAEAATLAADVAADPDGLSDATTSRAAVMDERLNALERRIDDASQEARGLFADLIKAQSLVENWILGLERTAHALAACKLDHVAPGLGCVSFCRKVSMAGRVGYLTVAGTKLVFQPVQTSGMLLWKTEHVGSPEMLDVSAGLTLTDIRRPMLGDHGVTLIVGGPSSTAISITLGRESLDDLTSAAS